MSKLKELSFAKEEIKLDIAGRLDAFWGDRFTKTPSVKVVKSTSSISVIFFLNDYCHRHSFPRKISDDHGSCFLSHDFKSFCENFNIGMIYYYTTGDHRSNRLIERFEFTVKLNLLAMFYELSKIVFQLFGRQKSFGTFELPNNRPVGAPHSKKKSPQPHC